MSNASWIAELKRFWQFKVLNKLAQPDTSVTVAEALQEFDNLISIAILSNEHDRPSNFAWYTFCVLFDMAVSRTAPTSQSKLVDSVVQLQKKKISEPTTGETLECDGKEI